MEDQCQGKKIQDLKMRDRKMVDKPPDDGYFI